MHAGMGLRIPNFRDQEAFSAPTQTPDQGASTKTYFTTAGECGSITAVGENEEV